MQNIYVSYQRINYSPFVLLNQRTLFNLMYPTRTTTAKSPFERCALDIVGPLTETTSGNRYILTFQDDLSKFLVAIPIPHQDAETVAGIRATRSIEIWRAGKLLTDQGTNF